MTEPMSKMTLMLCHLRLNEAIGEILRLNEAIGEILRLNEAVGEILYIF